MPWIDLLHLLEAATITISALAVWHWAMEEPLP